MMIIVMTFVLPGFEHSIANMGTFFDDFLQLLVQEFLGVVCGYICYFQL